MVIKLWGLDEYRSKHKGSRKNVQTNIGGIYEIKIIDRKYIRREKYENYAFK